MTDVRTQAHSRREGIATQVTKVMARTLLWTWLLAAVAAIPAWSQESPNPGVPAAVLGRTPVQPGPAESLYLQLRSVGLDQSRVYGVRDGDIDRGPLRISLDDGTIAFTQDVAGRVTGAFFEGDGEILLFPPNQVERASMALFTGGAILEERFVTAYFRFNDDMFGELRPALRPVEHAQEFLTQWDGTARNLADGDAIRLLMTFSQWLPVQGQRVGDGQTSRAVNKDDRMLHVRVQGRKLGNFDVYFDSSSPEQISAGQLKTVEGLSYYNMWTSFAWPQPAPHAEAVADSSARPIAITHYKIRTQIKPPTEIDAEAVLHLEVRQGGQRAVLFELSRYLQITTVEADGHAVEFIHNPALEGTQLSRRGNDLVAVVFPQPLHSGQQVDLRFVYGGAVLSEAGSGLWYVGARGIWFPNLGLAMANFDLEFRYPPGLTLVATGKRVDAASSSDADQSSGSLAEPAGEQLSRWVSERPIPIAGFNLGKYQRGVVHAGKVDVETYATAGVERGFPQTSTDTVLPEGPGLSDLRKPLNILTFPPSPAQNAQAVAASSARAIEFFSRHFGPFPYGELALTQMPGIESQGWPGLIFLSSFSFLTPEEKARLHLRAVDETLISQVVVHETAHQWWGDLVSWSGYRDQWMMEALANYSSLMLLESTNPSRFRAVMEKYRDDLLQKNESGKALMEDGPVTLGLRLSCSEFPNGYDAISYGRGTWLFHMLRYMMRDGELKKTGGTDEEPFVRALRRVRERYQGSAITTRELLRVFEEELPPSLSYEGQKSLQWFYQGWVEGSAIPHFELHGVKYSDKPGTTTITGTILQEAAPNDLVTSVPLYALRGGKMVLLGRVFVDGPESAFHVTAPLGTRKLVLDPNETLLARTR